MAEEADGLRAADADRELVAERLRSALNEGRLNLHEYDERLRDAYAAKTYGELKALLADLPTTVPIGRSQLAPRQPTPAVPPGGHTARWIAGMWSSWVTVAALLTVIWLLSGADSSFWPAWPLGIWGAILIAHTVTGLANGEPRKKALRDAKREAKERATRDTRDELSGGPAG